MLSNVLYNSSGIVSMRKLLNGTTPLPIASPRYSQRYLNSLRCLALSASCINCLDIKGLFKYVE